MSDDDAAIFPQHGSSPADVLAKLESMRVGDLDWRSGRAFSLVYNPGDDDHEHLLEQVATMFQHENALNPLVYPSLLTMELDLVAMAAELFGTASNAGSISSGGTESIFLAVQVARDHARQERGVDEPVLVTAITAHPAFAKAAHYLDVEHRFVPVSDDGRLDTDALAATVDGRTGLVVASAPCYPYGVIDDVPTIAAIAAEHGSLCHVDACLGGWLLPWFERIGEPVPPWDFRVEGVTSISADVHKYGYTFKGLSTIMYRTRELVKLQQFWYDSWPGGLYASGTTAGTRPAPPIAGAWAAIHHLGVEGYLAKAEQVRDAGRAFVDGIAGIDRLRITHPSDIPVFEFTAPDGSIQAIADGMDRRGWHLDRQQGGLHLMLSPAHLAVADRFIADLADAVAEAPVGDGDPGELHGTYGGIV
ncbi:MAG: aspartate aminotransferase family protein [Actinobacteria bacterium]|nr:aspartate aminotransferase family protein [Actinomycetota bacterium]